LVTGVYLVKIILLLIGQGCRPFFPFTTAGLKDKVVQILSYKCDYFVLSILNFQNNEMNLQHLFLFFGVTTSFLQRVGLSLGWDV
jgi:hypothetical protein